MDIKKVLLVEDDQDLQEMLQIKLGGWGFSVQIAGTGKAALKAMKEDDFSLIILDILLPEMDGLMVLEKMKKDDDFKDIPVLVFSNLGGDTEIQKAKDLGADEFLIKSETNLNVLVDKMKKMLGS